MADAQVEMITSKEQRNAVYQELNSDSIAVRDGVEGDANFGTNHPLSEAMGFTLESNRKSGLTRKKKQAPATKG